MSKLEVGNFKGKEIAFGAVELKIIPIATKMVTHYNQTLEDLEGIVCGNINNRIHNVAFLSLSLMQIANSSQMQHYHLLKLVNVKFLMKKLMVYNYVQRKEISSMRFSMFMLQVGGIIFYQFCE